MTARALVELSSRARRDLRRLGPGPQRKTVIDALTHGLEPIPPPTNLDVKALEGAAPYLRLRVGDYRVIYRPLEPAELAAICLQRERQTDVGFLVVRVVHRRELDRAVGSLA